MTTWYIWGGLVRWSFFSATTDPPSSSAGRVTGATGRLDGGLVAMKIILASGTSHRSLQVNWWRCHDIQAAIRHAIPNAHSRAANTRRDRIVLRDVLVFFCL